MQPYFNPFGHVKNSVLPLAYFTLFRIFSYMIFIIFKKLPVIAFFLKMFQNTRRFTVSKALRKPINAT